MKILTLLYTPPKYVSCFVYTDTGKKNMLNDENALITFSKTILFRVLRDNFIPIPAKRMSHDKNALKCFENTIFNMSTNVYFF